MKVLVTGGAGFIGSHLAFRLLRDGYQVRILDNLASGSLDNLKGLTSAQLVNPGSLGALPADRRTLPQEFQLTESCEFVLGDIRDPETCRRACSEIDYVFHQGALGSVYRSVKDPLTTHQVNATGTLNLLVAAREAGVRRFIYASSSSVYGGLPPPEFPDRDRKTNRLACTERLPLKPRSPYAVSKLCAERYCQVFSEVYGLETVSLRYFNVFGPRQNAVSEYAAVIPKFIAAMGHEVAPTIYGDGEQSRDFTFVSNVVGANMLAAVKEGVAGEVFNIGCGEDYSINSLVQALNRIMNQNCVANYVEPRQGDVRQSLADISKARGILGYEVGVSFIEGLRQTVYAMQANADQEGVQ